MDAEVRMARIVEAIGRWKAGAVSCVEAAELLGMSERHFRRLRDRYADEGLEGIIDRRRGRVSMRRAPQDRVDWLIETYVARYFDFTVKHFHEEITKRGHQYSYTWTKLVLQRAGVVKKAPKRSAHRKKRQRRPLPGMMLFQDGSSHEWLVGQPPLDLIVTMDDATSEVYSMFLVEQEGTASTFRGLAETIGKRGLFSSFYTDRGSHYFLTLKAGEKVSKDVLTQVGRALCELGIEHIPSYSPEGRGRMERLWGTLQGRLPQVLRLEDIRTIEEANRFMAETYMADHNARFAVAAAEEGTAFVPFVGDLTSVLCSKHARTVGNDNCVRFNTLNLQIPEQRHRRHYVRAGVEVREYLDGALAIFHGPRRLADYASDGTLITEEASRQSAA
jgi:transposase